LEFRSRDATTVRETYTYGGSSKELIVACAYLLYDADEPPPTKEVRDIINFILCALHLTPLARPNQEKSDKWGL
jgi:hypothetical protein